MLLVEGLRADFAYTGHRGTTARREQLSFLQDPHCGGMHCAD